MASSTTWDYPADRLKSRVTCGVPVLPETCVKWCPAVSRHGDNVPCAPPLPIWRLLHRLSELRMSTDQRDGGRAGDVQGPTGTRMLVGIKLSGSRDAAGITPEH